MPTCDVFIMTLDNQNQEWFDACLASLNGQPVDIRVIPGVDGNIGIGRRQGFELGTNPYVAYVDPDDLVMPRAFQSCIDALEADPNKVMAYTCEARISERGILLADYDRTLYSPFFNIKEEALRAHHLSVYRRSALPSDMSFLDDYPICAEQALKQRIWGPNKFAFVDMCGYQWRRHKQSASSKRVDYPSQVNTILKEMGELWRKLV